VGSIYGSIYGNTPMYQVKAFDTCGREMYLRPGTFEGERAFTDADELLDQLKADPGVMEVALLRLDGGEWEYRERSRRNDRGEWAAIPFSQNYPPPDDEDEE
jgi:hypothetical protein